MPSHNKRLDQKITEAIDIASKLADPAAIDDVAKTLSVIVDGDKTTVPPKEPWALIKPRHVERIKKALNDTFPEFKKKLAS